MKSRNSQIRMLLTATIGMAFLALAGTSLLAGAAEAAKRDDPVGRDRPERTVTENIVLKIQRGLRAAGMYGGPLDGQMNNALRAAISEYQRRTGRRVTGFASEELADRLQTQFQVTNMLRRLDQTKAQDIALARQKLQSRQETRRLLSEQAKNEVADPTRDASPCFRDPTEQCLLTEAVESAKSVFRTELRDWAFGEILVAQAKAGLVDKAIETVSRVGDPRLIIVALRDIAMAQAREGRIDDARSAAEIIPDRAKRMEAMAAIADIQLTNGDLNGATETAGDVVDLSVGLDGVLRRVSFLARMAVILGKAGQPDAARTVLGEARAIAGPAAFSGRGAFAERGAAMRHVASALADIGEPMRALEILDEVSGAYDRTAVRMSAASAQAAAGDTDRAMATAIAIENSRYQAVAFGRIAVAQAQARRFADAQDTIARALGSTGDIAMPYARSYAVSQVALSMIELGRLGNARALDRVVRTAAKIEDDRLRAYTLWSAAAAFAEAGNRPKAEEIDALAQQATSEIKSPLSQVWLLGDVAIERAALGQSDFAAAAFRRGIEITQTIHNSWGRARALAKMAATLHDLR